MVVWRAAPLLVGLCLGLAALSGCGGSGQTQSPASTTGKGGHALKPPAKPIYASCGTNTFTASKPTPVGRAAPPIGWQVTYLYGPGSARHPRRGQTTNVTLIELAPRPGPAPKLAGGREVTIAGRHVSLLRRAKATLYLAVWQTKAARYQALADGASPAMLERIIPCLS